MNFRCYFSKKLIFDPTSYKKALTAPSLFISYKTHRYWIHFFKKIINAIGNIKKPIKRSFVIRFLNIRCQNMLLLCWQPLDDEEKKWCRECSRIKGNDIKCQIISILMITEVYNYSIFCILFIKFNVQGTLDHKEQDCIKEVNEMTN